MACFYLHAGAHKPGTTPAALLPARHLHYLAQRNHHEVALMHKRMRNLKVRLVHTDVIIYKDVYVYRAVMITSAPAFHCAPHITLNGLSDGKNITRGKQCLHAYGGIDKLIVRLKAPRSGADERRHARNTPDALAYKPHGTLYGMIPVAEIGAETKINSMQSYRYLINGQEPRAKKTCFRRMPDNSHFPTPRPLANSFRTS